MGNTSLGKKWTLQPPILILWYPPLNHAKPKQEDTTQNLTPTSNHGAFTQASESSTLSHYLLSGEGALAELRDGHVASASEGWG